MSSSKFICPRCNTEMKLKNKIFVYDSIRRSYEDCTKNYLVFEAICDKCDYTIQSRAQNASGCKYGIEYWINKLDEISNKKKGKSNETT